MSIPYAYGTENRTVRVWYVPYAYGTKYAYGIEHNHRRSAFWWFERNRDKDHGDMTQNPTCVTITRSIFTNTKVLVFTPTRQTA